MEAVNNRLALGTVQFGMDYGISNSIGKTKAKNVSEILEIASDEGIDLIDTAINYGESEEILGQNNLSGFKVVSKFPHNIPPTESVELSMKRLRVDALYGLLAHNSSSIIENPDYWVELTKLKEVGKVEKIGFSLYYPEELDTIINAGFTPDLIQIPFNILDKRFTQRMETMNERGIEVHSRSAFLQGLFFMEARKLPDFFSEIKPTLAKLKKYYPQDSQRAAFLVYHCLKQVHIRRIIFGINTAEQLRNNITALRLLDNQMDIDLNQVSESILLPFKWPKIVHKDQ